MARHRDIRNMDFEEDYMGYDDVYGHSVDEDYSISPSNGQFIYNRESSKDAKLEHDEDIQEADEADELSDTEKAQLYSCMDEITNTLGANLIPRNELIHLILMHKFNVELVINAILEKSGNETDKEKDVTELFNCRNNSKTQKSNYFVIPKIFEDDTNDTTTLKSNFIIPKLISTANNTPTNTKFIIPNIFNEPDTSNNSTKANKKPEFESLKELAINHLKTNLSPDSVVTRLSNNLSNIKLQENPAKATQSLVNTQNRMIVDLSTALKATSSLPILSKNNDNNGSKNFDIPFIDGDFIKDTSNKFKAKASLPCNLNIRSILKAEIDLIKKPSSTAKILKRKYKLVKTRTFLQNIYRQTAIKEFSFNTISPDDFILSHLKR